MDLDRKNDFLLSIAVFVGKYNSRVSGLINACKEFHFCFFLIEPNDKTSRRKPTIADLFFTFILEVINKTFRVPQFDMIVEKCHHFMIIRKVLTQYMFTQISKIDAGVGE